LRARAWVTYPMAMPGGSPYAPGMRFAFALVLALAGASPPADAQSVDLTLPSTVLVGLSFSVELSVPCPPPGEAPPIAICNGPSLVVFQASERSAGFPAEPVTVFPFESVAYGPFVFHRKGAQYLIVWSTDGEFLGAATFVVEAPGHRR
jgi:hypothetical protein